MVKWPYLIKECVHFTLHTVKQVVLNTYDICDIFQEEKDAILFKGNVLYTIVCMKNGYWNEHRCDVAGRAESAFVAREEVQPGEVWDSHQDHAGTRDMDPGVRQDKHQAFMCITVHMHSSSLKGQYHKMDSFFCRSKHFNQYRYGTFICVLEITYFENTYWTLLRIPFSLIGCCSPVLIGSREKCARIDLS